MKKYHCIECNDNQTSEINCEKCGMIVDEYLKCEFAVKFIDLILCKTSCIRHFLYNKFNDIQSLVIL